MIPTNYKPINAIQPLPSGLLAKIIGWTVGDIANMGKRGTGGNLEGMIRRSLVSADPRGIYGFAEGHNLDPAKLMTSDRAIVIILQRIITHWRQCGPMFDFEFQCDDADCTDADGRPIPWSVDLRRFLLTEEDLDADELPPGEDLQDYADMPVYLPGGNELVWLDRFGDMPIVIGNADGKDKTAFLQMLSDEALANWKDGNRFEYVDPETGKRMWWKIMQGTDEAALQRHRKSPDKYRLNALGRRIVEIEDVQAFQKAQWLTQWGAGAEDELQEHINDIEPGLFKEFDVKCPRCGLIQEVSFPLDLTFFSPSTRKKKRGKTS